ncbi:MAG: heme NO-binding domain-containing protein [Alphaproteobacteria bacterium]|nr:heme NO-binding domain-containing protein [Alphaproteobacteria bacterium]
MRGLLFTEYLDFVEERLGSHALEDVIQGLDGRITAAYTSVGNYSFDEFALLHGAICKEMKADAAVLARDYGYHLFGRFETMFPEYFAGIDSGVALLEKLGRHIHEEVKKLYPDAKPPQVLLIAGDGGDLVLEYISHRPLAAVARGLTDACLDHFGDAHRIMEEKAVPGGMHFILKKQRDG